MSGVIDDVHAMTSSMIHNWKKSKERKERDTELEFFPLKELNSQKEKKKRNFLTISGEILVKNIRF